MSPEEQLLELLKTADAGVGKQVTQKSDQTAPKTNENTAQPSGGAEPFYASPKPPEEPTGTPTSTTPSFTKDIKLESQKDRDGELEQLFTSALDTASKTDQALISKNLDHGKSRDFESHSVLLKPSAPKSKTAESLMQRVQRLVGRV